MATTITLNATYSGKEPGSIGEAIVKTVIGAPELTSLGFGIRTDVRTKEKMYAVSMDEDVTRLRTGCGTPDVGAFLLREKFLDPKNMEISQHYCAEDFAGKITELARKVGANVNDLTDTDIEKILKQLVAPIWKRDMLTIATLGDTASADPKINMMDGLWKQLFAGVALTAGNPDKVTRTTTVTAGALAADYAINTILPNLYFGSSERLKSAPTNEKRFLVTGSVYDNYVQSLSKAGTLEGNRTALIEGIESVTYMGIPVVPVRVWDQKIATLLAGALPHRAMLVMNDAVQIGTDTMEEGSVMDFWYDKTTDKNYLRVRYKLAINYVDGESIAVAY
jgi:hypothetical protein